MKRASTLLALLLALCIAITAWAEGGGIALDYTLMGNRERNAFLVHKNNTNGPIAFGDRLRALLGDILNNYD